MKQEANRHAEFLTLLPYWDIALRQNIQISANFLKISAGTARLLGCFCMSGGKERKRKETKGEDSRRWSKQGDHKKGEEIGKEKKG